MREDMARVVVERPRINPRGHRKGRPLDLDDLRAREGMRRAHRGERKQFNENLAPLRRYLGSQVGRPWAKVYSDIAAQLRSDSTVRQHVRDHLRDFVAVLPRRNIAEWRGSNAAGVWWQDFYVDPKTGLLCRTDRLPEERGRLHAKRSRPSPPVESVALGGDRELRLIDGLWYELRMAPLPEPAYRVVREVRNVPLKSHFRSRGPTVEFEMDVRRLVSPPVRDAVAGKLIAVGPSIDDAASWETYRRDHPEHRYAAAKRVLSHRELRRHGLSNLPMEAR